MDLDNFIYTASHDLRAPITNIEGLLLALREQISASAALSDNLIPQLLDMMQGAVERFQVTIAQLTDIARLQQAHDLATEEVAVAEVVEAVRLDLAPQLTQAAAQLLVDVAPDLRVSFAPKNLRSVVYNLLSNAIKYRHPARQPVVRLRAERREPAVVFTVQDNGLGLSAQQQGQLFGLFQRLHTHVEGTGVGLYMVKRMVENVGGTITVQSQPEIGTTFIIQLPA
ncbi:sensor histidine kinase [Hymenobacter ginkgonis]|uniref:sensor histidine kinase n=1 Tax=Hymenobacter ginkgonis TaxID=2682976 RepID=UPI003742FD72